MNEIAPAGVPSGNGKYVAVALVLLLGIGGILVWKFVLDKPAPTVTQAPPAASSVYAEQEKKFKEQDELPPPPVKDEPPPPEPTKTAARVTAKGGPGVAVPAPGTCAGVCTGQGTGELSAAVRARAGAARGCYERYLAQDPSLRGSLTAVVRVGSTGNVCGVSIANNSVGGQVGACIQGLMAGAHYPSPVGGCVDVSSTMNFVPNH